MAINSKISLEFKGNPPVRPAQPMVIARPRVLSADFFAKWGGDFDETSEFANAGYDFYRYNYRPDLPDRSEFQIGLLETTEEWWARIRRYVTNLREPEAQYVIAVAVANMRPAWYADP
jgi:hypothetical protein